MNGIDYVADTNALLYLLSGNECMRPHLDKRLAISIISEMELLSFTGITETEEANVRALLSECKNLPLTEGIKETAIRLRRKYNTKLPDAIIAATAVDNSCCLLTADKGFMKIEELQVELLNPNIK